MQVHTIPIDQFVQDPSQPRKSFPEQGEIDMASSLLRFGQIVPMIALYENEMYLLLDGAMRLRGGKRASLSTMKALVLDKRPDEAELLMLQLTVNCMRTDLLPLERTESYIRLMTLQAITGSELAKRLGVSKGTVTRYVSHDSLSEELKAMLRNGTLSSAKAYAISRMNEEQRSRAIAELGSDSTRDDLERLARRPAKKNGTKSQIRSLRCELADCTLAVRMSKSMTVEELIDVLSDLLRACRKAKSQKLELGTMALVIRDRTRATKSLTEEVAGTRAE